MQKLSKVGAMQTPNFTSNAVALAEQANRSMRSLSAELKSLNAALTVQGNKTTAEALAWRLLLPLLASTEAVGHDLAALADILQHD